MKERISVHSSNLFSFSPNLRLRPHQRFNRRQFRRLLHPHSQIHRPGRQRGRNGHGNQTGRRLPPALGPILENHQDPENQDLTITATRIVAAG